MLGCLGAPVCCWKVLLHQAALLAADVGADDVLPLQVAAYFCSSEDGVRAGELLCCRMPPGSTRGCHSGAEAPAGAAQKAQCCQGKLAQGALGHVLVLNRQNAVYVGHADVRRLEACTSAASVSKRCTRCWSSHNEVTVQHRPHLAYQPTGAACFVVRL